jgi:hypothetical protein
MSVGQLERTSAPLHKNRRDARHFVHRGLPDAAAVFGI